MLHMELSERRKQERWCVWVCKVYVCMYVCRCVWGGVGGWVYTCECVRCMYVCMYVDVCGGCWWVGVHM